MTPQQEAAQAFANPQAAEVRMVKNQSTDTPQDGQKQGKHIRYSTQKDINLNDFIFHNPKTGQNVRLVIPKKEDIHPDLKDDMKRLELYLSEGASALGLQAADSLLQSVKVKENPDLGRHIRLWKQRFKRRHYLFNWRMPGKNTKALHDAEFKASWKDPIKVPSDWFNEEGYKGDEYDHNKLASRFFRIFHRRIDDAPSIEPFEKTHYFLRTESVPNGKFKWGYPEYMWVKRFNQDTTFNAPNLEEVDRLIRAEEISGSKANLAELYFYKGELEYFVGRFGDAKQTFERVEEAINDQFWRGDYLFTKAALNHKLLDRAVANELEQKGAISQKGWNRHGVFMAEALANYLKAFIIYDSGSNLHRSDRMHFCWKTIFKLAAREFPDAHGKELSSEITDNFYDILLKNIDYAPYWYGGKKPSKAFSFLKMMEEYASEAVVNHKNRNFLTACADSVMTLENRNSRNYVHALVNLGQVFLQTKAPAKARAKIEQLMKDHEEYREAYALREIMSEQYFGWKKANFLVQNDFYNSNPWETYLRIRTKEEYAEKFTDPLEYESKIVTKIMELIKDPLAFSQKIDLDSVDMFLFNLPNAENYMELYLKEELADEIRKYYPDSAMVLEFGKELQPVFSSSKPFPKQQIIDEIMSFYDHHPEEKLKMIENAYSQILTRESYDEYIRGPWHNYNGFKPEMVIGKLEAMRLLSYELEKQPQLSYNQFDYLKTHNTHAFMNHVWNEKYRLSGFAREGKIK